jgi:outer membrane protein TolC
VTTAYARRVAAGARAAAAAVRVASAAEERGRAARLVAEGAAAEVENLRAVAASAAAAAEHAEAAALEEAAVRGLARWMGVAPAAVRDRTAQPLAVTGPLPEAGAPSAEVERAAQEARAAEAEADVARAARLPRLDAQAALLEYGSSEGDFQGEWQAGVQVSFPVFTGGTRGAEIDRAAASARSAEAAVEVARLRQASEVDLWTAALTAALARTAALRDRAAALAEVERIEALALREGAGTQRAFLDAQADLFDARAALADARAEQARAAVELARAQGALTADWITGTLRPAP